MHMKKERMIIRSFFVIFIFRFSYTGVYEG